MGNDIAFRRIRGRIVPIKISADQKKRLKDIGIGTGTAAAGVGLSIASGSAYKRAVFNSANSAMKAFRKIDDIHQSFKKAPQMTLFDFAEKTQAQAKAFDSLAKSKRIANIAKGIRSVAVPFGAGLIGLGAYKIATALPKEKKKQIDPALVAGGSAAATVIAPKAYKFASNSFAAGMGGRQGVFKFGSSGFQKVKPHLKKLGELVFKMVF